MLYDFKKGDRVVCVRSDTDFDDFTYGKSYLISMLDNVYMRMTNDRGTRVYRKMSKGNIKNFITECEWRESQLELL